jgi:hypothetical protein
MSDRLLQLEKDLRSAVTGRRYPEVQKIGTAFCAQAAAEWRAFPCGDPRAQRIFDRLQSVLEWARLMVSTSRAAQADELRRARLTNRYLVRGSTTGSHLRFDI